MFGFKGGEGADTVARKKVYMKDAQQRWGYLTYIALSTVENEVQLRPIVKYRYGLSETEAKDRVSEWMQGKQF